MGKASSYDDSNTFRQSRSQFALAGLVALAFVAIGAQFVSRPDYWAQYARWGPGRGSAATTLGMGWVGIALFSACAIYAAIQMVMPTTVRFSSGGLTVKTVWRTRTRPWSALSNFRIYEYSGAGLVVFDDESPPSRWLAGFRPSAPDANSALPIYMDVSPEHLLDAARQAKSRWG